MEFLYRIETYGLKNISKPIILDFYPSTVDNNTTKKISKVKAIYGSNGVGKSAIIHSIYLYHQINMNKNFLTQENEIEKLKNLINKEKKEFYISLTFGNEKKEILKNELKLKLINDIPYIESEKLLLLKDRSINKNYELIYEVKNGDLKFNDKNIYYQELTNNIKEKTKNILNKSSLISSFIYTIDPKNLKSDKNNMSNYLLRTLLLSLNISVFLDEGDLHKKPLDNELYKFIQSAAKLSLAELSTLNFSFDKDVIPKSKINDYEQRIKKLTCFLRLFKPSLKEIRIEKVEDKNFYYCSKKFVYDSFIINSEYESSGIKKLIRLFTYIENVSNNYIVFIDELDANINGVYLNCLVEYINSIKKGQLCFTCHNLSPMEYLYKYDYSIDFLGQTGLLVPWKKNGNYKPYNQFQDGMIVDSPFNIDKADLIKVFGRDDI